jgi:hypothetical protein
LDRPTGIFERRSAGRRSLRLRPGGHGVKICAGPTVEPVESEKFASAECGHEWGAAALQVEEARLAAIDECVRCGMLRYIPRPEEVD